MIRATRPLKEGYSDKIHDEKYRVCKNTSLEHYSDVVCSDNIDYGERRFTVPMSPLKFSSDTVDPFTLLTASPIETKP